jgi:hypothetical protein
MTRGAKIPRSAAAELAARTLRSFAKPCIIEILLAEDGLPIKTERMNFLIRQRFDKHEFVEMNGNRQSRGYFHWHPELDDPLNGSYTYGQNAIAHARKALVQEGYISEKCEVPGGDYELVRDSIVCEQYLSSIIMDFSTELAANNSGTIRAERVSGDVFFSNAVYVISDPVRPDWCKVGAGSGDCGERLGNARLWTCEEARLPVYFLVGPGKGRQYEAKIHSVLAKQFPRRGEWFGCDWKEADRLIELLLREEAAHFSRRQKDQDQ